MAAVVCPTPGVECQRLWIERCCPIAARPQEISGAWAGARCRCSLSGMSILDHELLSADEEVELAIAIEAGVLARAVLDGEFPATGASSDELVALVQAGERAWEAMWLANMRLVWSVARPMAQRTRTNVDEVFQEGCVGLAEAIRRWDHRRGIRFHTLAWKWVRHHCQVAVVTQQQARRSRRELRTAAAARELHERLARDGRSVSLSVVADQLGHDAEQLVRVVEARHVPLGDVADQLADELAARRFEEVESSVPDWLYRLPAPERELLLLRYGFLGAPRTQEWCGRHFNMSTSSIRRMEQQALLAARRAAAAAEQGSDVGLAAA